MNNHSYQVGEEILTETCSKKCSCKQLDFHCISASCNPGQECTVKQGKLGCHFRRGICTVTGDPHYFTFDGAVAHFQGTCAYEISKTCHPSLPFFYQVVAENRQRGHPRVSFVSQVEVWLENGTLNFHIFLRDGKTVEVHGSF
uniref:VWFD domain-containing protein n=1 Tax=Salvator merianae TaxID=96440 RepID=A0A8D0BZQ8_SALMN